MPFTRGLVEGDFAGRGVLNNRCGLYLSVCRHCSESKRELIGRRTTNVLVTHIFGLRKYYAQRSASRYRPAMPFGGAGSAVSLREIGQRSAIGWADPVSLGIAHSYRRRCPTNRQLCPELHLQQHGRTHRLTTRRCQKAGFLADGCWINNPRRRRLRSGLSQILAVRLFRNEQQSSFRQ